MSIKHLRDDDQIFRYGGEEMTIIMRNLSGEDAHKMANLLRGLVANTPVNIGDGKM